MPKAAVLPCLDQPLEIRDVEVEDPRANEVKIRLGYGIRFMSGRPPWQEWICPAV